MAERTVEKRLDHHSRRTPAIYCASFLMGATGSVAMVVAPFVMKNVGASDSQVGLYMGLQMGLYMIGCLVSGGMLHRFDTKRIVLLGAGGMALAAAGMVCVATLEYHGLCPRPVMLMGLSLTLMGCPMALFWPSMMGWVSTGFEGQPLSRRLSWFSFAWAAGSLLAPYPATLLTEMNNIAPLAGALTLAVLCVGTVCVAFGRDRKGGPTNTAGDAAVEKYPENGQEQLDVDPQTLRRFRYVSRVALATVFFCTGLMRSQLGLLMKLDLGFAESDYGLLCLGWSGAIVVGFFVAGRTSSWHYCIVRFAVFQASTLAAILLILMSQELRWLALGGILMGAGQACIYSSHVFYGVSGRNRRSKRMAVHELTLSAGWALGCLVSGWCIDSLAVLGFGRRTPYLVGACVLVAGFVVQAVIWVVLKDRKVDGSPEGCGSASQPTL